ncbi:PREDICTED: E3 ubiquitin-protein ligase ZNRF3-like [Cyprinodon variegatus]|uniref:E3 ubiquitin-protein ligase ZNRF3-like n=1 Tax=Cyprinodon variegatus TaxID=28743 RepID=UPI000742A866|nr:PREDICTED: E3 ubiquitin-protein ligase ZNRF3-like [Cyprinodon variegatus]
MMIFRRRGSDRAPDPVVLLIWLLAASLGAVLAKDTAFVEVVLFESSSTGDYTTYTTGLQGRFSKAGATISAEGEIVQMHPLGLCNNNDEEDLYEYGWVGVVKLEQPELDPSCLTVLGKVKNNNPKHSHSYNRMGQSILMDLGLINEERLPSLLQKCWVLCDWHRHDCQARQGSVYPPPVCLLCLANQAKMPRPILETVPFITLTLFGLAL